MRQLLIKLVVLAVPAFALVYFRNPTPLLPTRDERTVMCVFDAQIGWVPNPGYSGTYTGSRDFVVTQNSLGFRDREPGPKTRRRVVVIGDSHVWGYDADQDARFTDLIGKAMPDVQIINAGVSGYGTDQEFLLLKRDIDRLQPDAVIVVYTEGDEAENSTNMRYNYNKPYFVDDGRTLTLAGVPVARPITFYATGMPWLFAEYHSRRFIAAFMDEFRPAPVVVAAPTRGIVREMQRMLSARGVSLGFAMQAPNPAVQDMLTSAGIPWVDVQAPVGAAAHWTPEGHRLVAARLEPLVTQLLRQAQVSPPATP